MRFLLTFLLAAFLLVNKSIAGEGMWLPVLLDSLRYSDMQAMGLHIKAEDIYSVNHASLKDAIVMFGGGCTGEVISPEGLLITNYHCGYSRIQAHSTVVSNYLENGFWAASDSEELPNPGLYVSFLVRMENVTEQILKNISDTLSERSRNDEIGTRINAVRDEAMQGTHYKAEVKPFYFGREYYLFVYEVFNDVRLVGAPPETIGRFGGDSDNWIWPRHTGDFSLFRIYADKNNQPADYAPDNVPYKPRKFLNVSISGVHEGDFTMVMGFPGHTDQYLVSEALKVMTQETLPAKTEMRARRLEAMKEEMTKSPELQLAYSAKYVSISNSWKKWMGITKGVKHAGVIEEKEKKEQQFEDWSKNEKSDSTDYSCLMKQFADLYGQYDPLYVSADLTGELLNSFEISPFFHRTYTQIFTLGDSTEDRQKVILQNLKKSGAAFFQSHRLNIDRKIMPDLLKIYSRYTDTTALPAFYATLRQNYQGNYGRFVEGIFAKSLFTDSARFMKWLKSPAKKRENQLSNDPLTGIYRDFSAKLSIEVYQKADSMEDKLNGLYRKYISGLMAMNPGHTYYPDANFTLRLTYGQVDGYKPGDGITYSFGTTLDGIMEKDNPDIADYRVPEQLRELFRNRDFGKYGEGGKMPVCFLATNHTSGGNSGSPVLNANGDLVGINFDRNWEGTMSDYAYDPSVCRNISLDVRYVLFIMDRVGHAERLIKELHLK
jgi:hypothetical protein